MLFLKNLIKCQVIRFYIIDQLLLYFHCFCCFLLLYQLGIYLLLRLLRLYWSMEVVFMVDVIQLKYWSRPGQAFNILFAAVYPKINRYHVTISKSYLNYFLNVIVMN